MPLSFRRFTAHSALHSVARSLPSLSSVTAVRGAALEAAWIVAHLATYAVGIRPESRRRSPGPLPDLEDLTVRQRALLMANPTLADTPILLIHGFAGNRSVFRVLKRSLKRCGFRQVSSINYSPLTMDVRVAAQELACRVEDLCLRTEYDRVNVIGHSLGGLIARYHVQRLGGDASVDTLVTLGTPHHGTTLAHLFNPHPIARQLRPDSSLIRELDLPAPGCSTSFVAFHSDLDEIVLPWQNARLDHPGLRVRNIAVHGVGHMSLPVSGTVVHGICSTLTNPDTDVPVASSDVPRHRSG